MVRLVIFCFGLPKTEESLLNVSYASPWLYHTMHPV